MMESTGDIRLEGTKQDEDNERWRATGVRATPGALSPHIHIDEQDSTNVSIRKAQKDDYRRKRNKTNNDDHTKVDTPAYSSENESMQGSEGRREQVASIKEVRDKTKAILKCIELAYYDSPKKAPSAFDESELYEFVETLERKIVMQMEKNLMLAEQNLSLAEQALYLSGNNNKETKQENENEHGAKKLYKEILLKERTIDIQGGKKLPTPTVPSFAKHFPSDCVVIIKANTPGKMLTENEIRRGKDMICRQIGNVLALEIMVIRTTRSGGYIIVLKTPAKREEIRNKLNNDELMKDKIILPKAKLPKIICRNVTDEFSVEELQRDLYSWKNQKLQTISAQERKAKIIQTRLGVVMELSSMELMAIELQDWRIRFGYGNEIKVEEFIPIQQCYNCSCFGHSADNCKNMPRCRLCASSGHSGRDCNKRTDKTQWKCTNCLDSNLRRNTKLNCNHGAAQLHKCQIALNEKEIKRQQMANEGIYVSKSSGNKIGTLQKSGHIERDENFNNVNSMERRVTVPNMEQLTEEKRRKLHLEKQDRTKNVQIDMQMRNENEQLRRKNNNKTNESDSEIEKDEDGDEAVGVKDTNPRLVRSVHSQRKGFGQPTASDEGDVVDERWITHQRGRSKSTGRQRSVSRIRRSGLIAKPQHHTRSTTSLGEELLAYSPVKRKDAIRRGRPTRSGDTTNEDDVAVDLQNTRMTPRSEGYGVRLGRVGGYVDRRGGDSHKESDEAMSVVGDVALESKGKDRNDR